MSDLVTVEPGQVWRRRWYADLLFFLGPFLPKYLRVKYTIESDLDGRIIKVSCVDAEDAGHRTYEMPVTKKGTVSGFKFYSEPQ